MKAKTQESIVNVSALMTIGVVFIFTVIRLFYGAELSDEAYAVAETYMVSKGALPFVNNWSQMPGFTLLLAPFVKLYTVIVGGTDGIFLFYRFLSLMIHLLTALMVSYLLKDHVKNRILLVLFSMIYVRANGWDYVYAFRGDYLAIDLLAIGALLMVVYFADDSENLKLPFISGILSALSALSYPVCVISVAYFIVVIVFLCYKGKKSYRVLWSYILGAMLATIIVVGYLAINSGVSDIFQGICYLLNDVTYFRVKNDLTLKLFGYMKDMAKITLLWLVGSAGCFACLLFVDFVRKKIFKADDEHSQIKCISIRNAGLISLVGGICLCQTVLIWRLQTKGHPNPSLYVITIETLAVPLILFFVKSERNLCKYCMGFIWYPTYIVTVITGMATYSSMSGRHPLLKNAAFLFGIFVYFAANDNFDVIQVKNDNSDLKRNIFDNLYCLFLRMIPVMPLMITSFTYLFNSYAYVHRDEPIRMLNTSVFTGPYKGMRTTKMRADGLLEVDEIIDRYVDQDDYVLAMDNDPFIYLMSEGKICTPSTWDQALYSYGFNQPDLYYDYFKVTGTEPTKIIYFNYGRDEMMSIDMDYKFNDYVNDNFHLIYEDRNIFVWNYCNKNITCEILIYERN